LLTAGARQFFAGWRGLGRFWLVVVAALAAGGVGLHFAGPRPAVVPPAAHPAPPPPQPAAAKAAKPPPAPSQPPARPGQPRPGRDTPGPVADADPALLEPMGSSSSDLLPRIAADGRMPMQVYATGFDSSSRRPRIGLVLGGIGLNQAESEAAIRALPHGITLAISPYAQNINKLLSSARAAEHEYLVSIPMEPQGFPLNDPGRQALMTSLSLEENRERLLWVLTRITGYVGAIGAEGALRGERYASLPDEMNLVAGELARRGLLYVDPRPGSRPPPRVWERTVDLVIDEPPTAADIDGKLARLSQLARDNGSALGYAGAVRPVTVQRLAAWANALPAEGLALAPVSALVQPPEQP
jgi:hypothetical protein